MTLRSILVVLFAGATLAACGPRPDRDIARAPTERARTSHIDDYFTFKWTETGRQVSGWGN